MPVRTDVARAVARHSVFWLVAANGVGLWLALILVWPELGDVVSPFTYGRWAPLHLNWQLYGWCSLPLVGVLYFWYLDPAHPQVRRHARFGLGAWSAALVGGGVSWLGGQSSGKLFLDWRGFAQGLLPAAMMVLWTLLAAHTWWSWSRYHGLQRWVRLALLLVLSLVPAILFLTSEREFFPPINPDSGGATGAALLGSTLAVVSLFCGLPLMLDRPPLQPTAWVWPALGLSWAIYALIDHGSTSHHAFSQIASLGLLLVWVPLLVAYWTSFDWPEKSRPWLRAVFIWWLLLVVTGWLVFLPGISEQLKFTNGLVAHAHLAMAGLVTSVHGVILATLGDTLSDRLAFWLWQVGCAAHVMVLLWIAFQEGEHADELFRSEPWTQAAYVGRLVAGGVMMIASVRWWREVRR